MRISYTSNWVHIILISRFRMGRHNFKYTDILKRELSYSRSSWARWGHSWIPHPVQGDPWPLCSLHQALSAVQHQSSLLSHIYNVHCLFTFPDCLRFIPAHVTEFLLNFTAIFLHSQFTSKIIYVFHSLDRIFIPNYPFSLYPCLELRT